MLRADHFEFATLVAFEDGKRKTIVALLGDHPVVHVAEPVELARLSKRWDPLDILRNLHKQFTDRLHADEPLVDQPKHKLRTTSPADRIPVGIRLNVVEDTLLFEAVVDRFIDVEDTHPR